MMIDTMIAFTYPAILRPIEKHVFLIRSLDSTSLGNAINTLPGDGSMAGGKIGFAPSVNANHINKKIKTPNIESTIDCDFDRSPLSLNIQLTGNNFTDGDKNKKGV